MCRFSKLLLFSFFFCKDGSDRLMKRASYSCNFLCVVLAAAYLKYRRCRLSCLRFVWHFFFHCDTHTHTHTHTHIRARMHARVLGIDSQWVMFSSWLYSGSHSAPYWWGPKAETAVQGKSCDQFFSVEFFLEKNFLRAWKRFSSGRVVLFIVFFFFFFLDTRTHTHTLIL